MRLAMVSDHGRGGRGGPGEEVKVSPPHRWKVDPASDRVSRIAGVALAVVLIVGLATPALATKRLDLYDPEGRYVGYALLHHRAGRVDYYDVRDRRIGWGQVNALSERYRVDLFAADGLATGYALVDLGTHRVQFFSHSSHLLGSGTLDKTGRVTTYDLSGRRLTDSALPLEPLRPARSMRPTD